MPCGDIDLSLGASPGVGGGGHLAARGGATTGVRHGLAPFAIVRQRTTLRGTLGRRAFPGPFDGSSDAGEGAWVPR